MTKLINLREIFTTQITNYIDHKIIKLLYNSQDNLNINNYYDFVEVYKKHVEFVDQVHKDLRIQLDQLTNTQLEVLSAMTLEHGVSMTAIVNNIGLTDFGRFNDTLKKSPLANIQHLIDSVTDSINQTYSGLSRWTGDNHFDNLINYYHENYQPKKY